MCGPVEGGPLGRRHHFWECPVAQAVVAVMQQQLVGWMAGPLQPHHVLCMVCPAGVRGVGAPALHRGVWRVVCLAAICALDGGRRAANFRVLERRRLQAEAVAVEAAAQRAAAVAADQRQIDAMLQLADLPESQQQHRDRVRQRQQARVEQQLQFQQQEPQQAAAAARNAATQQAVRRFWELLHDFVVVSAAPAQWCDAMSPAHPFLRVEEGVLGVHRAAVQPGPGPVAG